MPSGSKTDSECRVLIASDAEKMYPYKVASGKLRNESGVHISDWDANKYDSSGNTDGSRDLRAGIISSKDRGDSNDSFRACGG
jgi:hypothetical protein